MNVYLSEGGKDLLRGDLVVRWVLRSDLAPVPRTVELSVRVKDGIEAKLKEGGFFWTGREMLKYRIIKAERPNSSGLVQGDEQVAVLSVTAILDSCHRIAFRRNRAVVRDSARFSELYRACGAEVPVANDFTVSRFACYVGQVPSFHLAQTLQEEGGALVLREGKIAFVRTDDLLKQAAKTGIAQTDSSDMMQSGFLERHEIPAYFSVAPDGSFVRDTSTDNRALEYLPRMDARRLRNLSRVLVTRRIVRSTMAAEVVAGDCLEVAGKKMVVITGAHVYEQNEGQTESYSKLWVGDLNR